jgi:extracellular elastinolytic metalloproteinase
MRIFSRFFTPADPLAQQRGDLQMSRTHRRDDIRRQIKNYRPALDTLEDRSLPGNSFIGGLGISNPLSILSRLTQTQRPTSGQRINTAHIAPASPATAAQTALAAAIRSRTVGQSQPLPLPTINSSSVGVDLSTLGGSASQSSSSAGAAALQIVVGSSSYASSGATTPGGTPTGTSSAFFGSPPASDGGAAVGAAAAAMGTGTTPTTNHPVYDAATQARLDAYVDAGGVGYMQAWATPPRGLSATQQAAADALKTQIPGLIYEVNDQNGTPTSIINATGNLTGPQAGSPTTIALNYLNQIAPLLGVQQSDINSLTVNKTYGETVGTSGVALNYVYLQQQVGGIPVYGETSVTMRNDGTIGIVDNGMIPNLLASVNTLTPTISPASAVMAAAQNLGLPVTSPIVERAAPVGPQQKVTLSDGGFTRQDTPAELVLLPTGNGSTRLAWHVMTWLKNDYLFEFYVDATTGSVLQRNSLTDLASYKVLPVTAKAPNQGTISTVVNPADPLASPFGWHDTNGRPGNEYTITRGNNVSARARRDSTAPGSLGYLYPSGGTTETYNYGANFSNDPQTYQAAAAVNLFYDVNTWHDVSYHYGFTELAGNYQQNNYGRAPATTANDAVQAFAQDDADLGQTDNAFFVSPPDGTSGEVHMFVWDFTGPFRDGDFDNEVVFHELGHGINDRLVGGGSQIGSLIIGPQADAMNEGWADFDSLFYTTSPAAVNRFNSATPSGTYVLGQNSTTGIGIRRFPYSANKNINPLTYADFDPSQINVQFPPNPPLDPSLAPADEAHNGGEIWCNTLWEMESNLAARLGVSSNLFTGTGGNNRAYQLYITGLKLTTAFPSMLDGRNAIVAADNLLYGGADLADIWGAFADRGMGVFANPGVFSLTATNPGWQSNGIVEDFTVPDNLPVPPPPPGGDGSNDSLYEPNQTSNQAFNLGSLTGQNNITNLAIQQVPPGTPADQAWFKFTTTHPGALTVTQEVAPGAGDLEERLYLLHNGSPNYLTQVGTGQGTGHHPGQNQTITIAVGAGQTYYVNLFGYNGAVGNYNLDITAPS